MAEGDGGFGHRFAGPSRPGFLVGVAWLRLALRREADGSSTVLVQIRHKAGHALPGGTTGRSVWLVVEGLDSQGQTIWSERARFGWEHGLQGGWKDRTLPPGRPVTLELPDAARGGVSRVGATLWYRFSPGPLEAPDPRAVLLDRSERVIPAEGD